MWAADQLWWVVRSRFRKPRVYPAICDPFVHDAAEVPKLTISTAFPMAAIKAPMNDKNEKPGEATD